jgi:hypothetical protein
MRMNKMNVDPMITFSDGSQLLVSTQYAGEGRFTCELYLSKPGRSGKGGWDLQTLSDRLEAPTCRQAQDIACCQARRLYPNNAPTIKDPPYLVWAGPNLPVEPETRWRRSM